MKLTECWIWVSVQTSVNLWRSWELLLKQRDRLSCSLLHSLRRFRKWLGISWTTTFSWLSVGWVVLALTWPRQCMKSIDRRRGHDCVTSSQRRVNICRCFTFRKYVMVDVYRIITYIKFYSCLRFRENFGFCGTKTKCRFLGILFVPKWISNHQYSWVCTKNTI